MKQFKKSSADKGISLIRMILEPRTIKGGTEHG